MTPPAQIASTIPRPRTIVTADPELDDLNSMIRLLLYSNEIEIEGLIYASSRFHWRGDGAGTRFFLPDREYDEPQTSWRWAPGERFIDDAVDAYAEVHANLVVHDPRYPSPERLRSVIREGNVDFEGDTSAETPGSRLIADVLLDERPGPVFLQLWAGPSTVARALRSIEERFRDTSDWEAVHTAVSAKAVITKFASQDATYDEYIAQVWPGIRVIEVATLAWGYMARWTVPAADHRSAERRVDARERHERRPARRAVPRLGRRAADGAGRHDRLLPPVGAVRRRAPRTGVQGVDRPAARRRVDLGGGQHEHAEPARAGLRGHEHPAFGGWGGVAVRTYDGATRGSHDADSPGSRHARRRRGLRHPLVRRCAGRLRRTPAVERHAPGTKTPTTTRSCGSSRGSTSASRPAARCH